MSVADGARPICRSALRTSRPVTWGPQGLFAKIPGSDAGYRLLTRALPLHRGVVVERQGTVFVS